MRYFTSDTHFGHKNIIQYCERPFADVEEMNVTLVQNWNNVVGEDDIVYHLGDVALGPWSEWDKWLSQLNGHKVLIVGNHDRLFQETNEARFDRWLGEYSKWFDEIRFNGSTTLSDGTFVHMSHFPYDGDSHDGDRFTESRLPDDGTILLHGHTHSNSVVSRSAAGTPQIHVGADAHGYTPVSEEQVVSYLRFANKGVTV
jgi:calcineurin-like phosphoesterase family protein